MENLKTLNMCDFCSKEITVCGAKTVLAKEIDTDQRQFTALLMRSLPVMDTKAPWIF
ncbi:MAG: hypothetical protein O3A78_13375 [Nitrospinae bacterium]|jgi:hypothetical protein|nr:hypothetical protein [Nitrospinota bacterium]MDA1110782.1 hypothetical protein [Nitrospinota bacterium]